MKVGREREGRGRMGRRKRGGEEVEQTERNRSGEEKRHA